MPLYDFKCDICGFFLENHILSDSKGILCCKQCSSPMRRLFPTSVHTKVGESVDSKDIGKRVKEKNTRLKKRESGYAHEEQNLRKKMNKMVEEKMKDK